MQTPKFEEPNYVTVTVFSNAQPMSIVNLRRKGDREESVQCYESHKVPI